MTYFYQADSAQTPLVYDTQRDSKLCRLIQNIFRTIVLGAIYTAICFGMGWLESLI